MKKKFLLIMAIIIVVVGAVGYSKKTKKVNVQADSKNEEKYVPVSVEKVAKKTISNVTTYTGEVFAANDLAIVPKLPGKVTSINVKVGSKVKAGDVLFTLDKKDVENQLALAKIALDSAKVRYDADMNNMNPQKIENSKQNLERTKQNYSEKLAVLKENLERTKELSKQKLDSAKLNLERTKQLYEAGAASKVQLEQAEQAVTEIEKSTQSQIVQTEQSITELESTSKTQIEQLELGIAELESGASTQLKQAHISYNQAQVSYNQAMDALNNTVITSPIDGVVSSVNIEVGEFASNAQPSVTVVGVGTVTANINVTENVINKIKKGQEVLVDIPSASMNGVKGTIDNISPAADARTKLFPVKIYLNNKDNKIKPGMFAKVKLDTDKKENILVVKSEAVLQVNDKYLAYIVLKDKAVEKEVKVGLDTGEYVEILSGIKEGEKVIVKGQEYVENNTKVKVVGGAK